MVRTFPYCKTKFSDAQRKNSTAFYFLNIEIQLEITLNRFKQGYVMDSFPKYELTELYFSSSDFNETIAPYFESDSTSAALLDNEIYALFFSITTSTLLMQKSNQYLSLRPKYWSSSIITIVHEWISEFIDFLILSLHRMSIFI